jgi:hypothetical protein
MRKFLSVLSLVVAAAIAVTAVTRSARASAASASSEMQQASSQEQSASHSHEKCELHGGEVVMTPTNHFEVLFTDQEARVYVYDEKQAPIVDLAAAKATLTLETKAGKSASLAMTYLKPDAAAGRTQGALVVRHDFTSITKAPTKALFHLEGIGAKVTEFKSTAVLGTRSIYVCPMHPDVTGEDPGKCSRCGMNLVKQGGPAMHEHGAAKGEETEHHHP